MKTFKVLIIVVIFIGLFILGKYLFLSKKWFKPSDPYVVNLSHFKGSVCSFEDFSQKTVHNYKETDLENVSNWGEEAILIYYISYRGFGKYFVMKAFGIYTSNSNVQEVWIKEFSSKDLGFTKKNFFIKEGIGNIEYIEGKKIILYPAVLPRDFSAMLFIVIFAIIIVILLSTFFPDLLSNATGNRYLR